MVEGREDVGDVEGKEAAVARLVGEKLQFVTRCAIRAYPHAPLLVGAVGHAQVGVGRGDERLELVEVGAAQSVELVEVDKAELGASQLFVLAAEVGGWLAAAVAHELRRDDGIEPCALVYALLADEHNHLMVDHLGTYPRRHHRHKPLAEAHSP